MKKNNKIVILVFIILLIVSLLVWIVGPLLEVIQAPENDKNIFPIASPTPEIPASFVGPTGSPPAY